MHQEAKHLPINLIASKDTDTDRSEQKSEAAISTDEEYADAFDSPSELCAPNDPVITSHLKTEVVSYVQTTTQQILEQIQVLSNTLHRQRTVIQRFIDSMVSFIDRERHSIGLETKAAELNKLAFPLATIDLAHNCSTGYQILLPAKLD